MVDIQVLARRITLCLSAALTGLGLALLGCAGSEGADEAIPRGSGALQAASKAFVAAGTEKLEFPGSLKGLEIKLGRGRVRVVGGADAVLRVELTKLLRANLSEADKGLAGKARMVPQIEDGKLMLHAQAPDGSTGWTDLVGFDLIVRAPATWSGGFERKEPTELPCVKIDAVKGDVLAADLRCALRVDTVSGKVSMNALNGEAVVHTAEGDISATGCAWQLARLKSSGGRVDAALSELGSGNVVHLSSSAGDVRVALPAGADCCVEADTTGGQVSTEMPALEVGIRYSGRSLRGVLGSGSGLLKIQSTTGNIRIDG